MRTIILLVLISIVIISCESNPTQSGPENGSISFSSYLSQTTVISKSGSVKVSGINAVDSIQITRARFLIRNVKFKTAAEDSNEFKSAPIVIDLNFDGIVNTISVSNVPYDIYDRIEFTVHRLDPDDPMDKPFVNEPQFSDFMTSERLSIIVEGTVYEAGTNSKQFIFESRINEKQKHFLTPSLTVTSESPNVNVTMFLNSARWFSDSNGNLLNPTDQSNENEIEDNLKDSIEFIKDNNKDGIEDNS